MGTTIKPSDQTVKARPILFSAPMVTPRSTFEGLWDCINGKTHPWKSNPFVFVTTFKRIKDQ